MGKEQSAKKKLRSPYQQGQDDNFKAITESETILAELRQTQANLERGRSRYNPLLLLAYNKNHYHAEIDEFGKPGSFVRPSDIEAAIERREVELARLRSNSDSFIESNNYVSFTTAASVGRSTLDRKVGIGCTTVIVVTSLAAGIALGLALTQDPSKTDQPKPVPALVK